jgi:hypothetical protein
MRNMILGFLALTAAAGAGAAAVSLLNQPANAQAYVSGGMAIAAANAGNGSSDMWAIDQRTNLIIFCRSTAGNERPVCRTQLVPGSAQPADKLPR